MTEGLSGYPRDVLALLVSCSIAVPQVPDTETATQDPRVQVLDPEIHHLGNDRTPEWKEAPAEPERAPLRVTFEGRHNEGEVVLRLRTFHVDEVWHLSLNGRRLVTLHKTRAWRDEVVPVPPGTLRDGRNELRIDGPEPTDDFLVGDFRLVWATLREHLQLRVLEVRVTEAGGGLVPAKITVAARGGRLPEIYYAESPRTAVRPGIVYTADGRARLELPAGRYRVYATRGMEWSMASEVVDLSQAPMVGLDLQVRREVDTEGFVAADTHVHTFTFSGHGDASVEERLITLAAEGVELAIATDHNHNTDYRPAQERMKLHEHFRSVTGNEVTTEVGHFNAFPLDPKGAVPDHHLLDWVRLVEDMRAKGAKVVILNHPRWPEIHTGPFARGRLNRLSGEFSRPVPFDAVEVVNSTTLTTDPWFVLQDWLALWNAGHQVTAVGSSDSHTVGDPVGQGRTYVRSRSDRPREIDLEDVCAAFVRGDASVALGIFVTARIAGRGMGGLARASGEVGVELTVRAPGWVRPREAFVYVNGRRAARKAVPSRQGEPTDATLLLPVRLPPHDAYVVCAVSGDGVSAPFWRTMEPYTLGATNPIRVDVDGDGRYSSPAAQARALVARAAGERARLVEELRAVDDTVAVQVLARLRREWGATGPATATRLAELVAACGNRPALLAYLRSVGAPAAEAREGR